MTHQIIMIQMIIKQKEKMRNFSKDVGLEDRLVCAVLVLQFVPFAYGEKVKKNFLFSFSFYYYITNAILFTEYKHKTYKTNVWCNTRGP